MKKNNLATLVARVMVMACAILFSLVAVVSCDSEPMENTYVDITGSGNGKPEVDVKISSVIDYECKLVDSEEEIIISADGTTTVSKKYNFKKEITVVYTDRSEKDSVVEFSLEHKAVIRGLNNVFQVEDIKELANQRFNVENKKVVIAGHEVRVDYSRNDTILPALSNGSHVWIFSTKAKQDSENVTYIELCSNDPKKSFFSFGDAQKVEGTDNTYNLGVTFTGEPTEGDDMLADLGLVTATTSEKDEVIQKPINPTFVGGEVVFDGATIHTLHPELNDTVRGLKQKFSCSLEADKLLRKETKEEVEILGQNGSEFSSSYGKFTLNGSYAKEVTIEYGTQLVVAIPAPEFKELNSKTSSDEDADFYYINTTKTYGMCWSNVSAISAEQSFQGFSEKEKDVVSIELEYTEKNGIISGSLWERHTLLEDVKLLTLSAERALTVTAEQLISREVETNKLARSTPLNGVFSEQEGSWSQKGVYSGQNVKGQTMSAVYTYIYNSDINNKVTVSMNRGLYVEYQGKKYQISDPVLTLTGSNPHEEVGSRDENSKYWFFNWSVIYTAKAADMSETATQLFRLSVEKPQSTFEGWEVDETYSSRFAITYSWKYDRSNYDQFHGLVFRKTSDHNQKKIAVFKVTGNSYSLIAEQNCNQAEADNFLAVRSGHTPYVSVSYATDSNTEVAALRGDFSKRDNTYKNGFGYEKYSGGDVSFSPTTISLNNYPEPYRSVITKDSKGRWGGLFY